MSNPAMTYKEDGKLRRGRPKTITDMKSYKRDKMREYRAAKKEKQGKV